MIWIHRLISLIHYVLAIQLREKSMLHMTTALRRLDDRMLADIGVPRDRISEYAREVAQWALPVAPMPTSERKSVLAQLRSWRERRATIRELSALDDRLLRDIGIEPGRVEEVIDAALNQRRDLWATNPMIQLLDTSAGVENGVKMSVARTSDVRVVRACHQRKSVVRSALPSVGGDVKRRFVNKQ